MSRKWVKPQAVFESFIPNDAVSACWGVGCDIDRANAYEHNTGNDVYDVSHGASHCGFAGNQVIYDDNGDGVADRMVEVGTDGLGTLTCTIYTSDSYRQQRDIGSVRIGDSIYWTTRAGRKTWHHMGTVFETVPGHPNRS